MYKKLETIYFDNDLAINKQHVVYIFQAINYK